MTHSVAPAPRVWWERVLAALALLISGLIPLAIPLGLITFAVLRKRYPYGAYHALLAVFWSCTFLLAIIVIGLTARLFPDAASGVSLLQSRAQDLPRFWSSLPTAAQATLASYLTALGIVLLVGFAGAVVTLLGKMYRLPVLAHFATRAVGIR
jgi:hypothetical protein